MSATAGKSPQKLQALPLCGNGLCFTLLLNFFLTSAKKIQGAAIFTTIPNLHRGQKI